LLEVFSGGKIASHLGARGWSITTTRLRYKTKEGIRKQLAFAVSFPASNCNSFFSQFPKVGTNNVWQVFSSQLAGEGRNVDHGFNSRSKDNNT
jgi:hypothetical protein